MSSLILKNINFSNNEESENKFKAPDNFDGFSAKSIAYVLRWQLARRRAGSAKVKSMSEISGTTAKPYKQKGTGNARQGSKRSVQFVGGRTCHGPTPRSFDFTMPKKISKKALSDIIKLKISENKIFLYSDVKEGSKTSEINAVIKKRNFKNPLIIFDSSDNNIVKTSRNMKNLKLLNINGINVYDIVNSDDLLIDSKIFESKILGALL